MTNFLWIFFCALFALFLELFCAYNYLAVPAIAMVCFYVTIVFGWRKAVFIFVAMAAIFDVVVARSVPFTTFVVLSVAALGEFCHYIGMDHSRIFSGGSAVLLSLCMLIWASLAEIVFPDLFVAISWAQAIWTKGVFIFSPVIVMPVCIFVFDSLAKRVGASTLQDRA